MAKDKVTIYHVAEHANVGISTVSRVLNDSPKVTVKTRERVMEVMRELNFRPDRTARSLAQQSTRYLAVAIPSFTTPFHTELLKGVRRCLLDENFDLLLCDLGSGDRSQVLADFLRRGSLDGLLLVGVPMDEIIREELKTLSAPVVLIGSHSRSIDNFYWDDVAGAHVAVTHLVQQGHKRIGLIRTHLRDIDSDDRFLGYQQALAGAGIEVDMNLVVGGETEKHRGYSEETGYEGMQKLLEVDQPVSAVFACSDVQALGAWRAIKDDGKSVPNDIALVGYDNLKSSQYLGLTTVDQQMGVVGEEATKMLLQRMRGEKTGKPESKLITPELIVRRSSQANATTEF